MGAGNTIALIKALAKVDPETIQDSVNDWLDDHPEATTTVEDGSITKAKLDSNLQSTVDEVSELSVAVPYIFTDAMKTAIINLFNNVAYVNDNGQDYIDTLSEVFFPTLISISATFTQPSSGILPSANLSTLKQYLVVTATMSDTSTHIVQQQDYILTGTLTAGYSTITVSYGGKTSTFTCLVDYVLSSAIVLDGSNKVDTGLKFTDSDYFSICCDVTFSGNFVGGNKPEMIWGTYQTGTSDYFALYAMYTGTAYRLQGGGIASGDSFDIITGDTNRIRSVAVINASTGAVTNYIYNVTNNASFTKSNTYNTTAIASAGRNIFIGHPEEQYNYAVGMSGTVNSLEIHAKTMTNDEITAYLAGE